MKCIEDEIPFEIPESWAWVRLGTISTYAETKRKINIQEAPSDVWSLDLEDIEKGGRLLEYKTAKDRKTVGDRNIFKAGNILYSKLRPYLLKILIAQKDGICSSEIVPFSLYGGIISEYVITVLKCPYIDNLINSATYGVKMPRVSTETMSSLFIPIPSIKEQQRIVRKLNEVTPIISEYDSAYSRVKELDIKFPQQLKRSVLQYAVQGKLVQQDESDEPASALLDRIRAEKEELIKQGKIKRDKRESVIYQGADNSYYERFADGSEKCIDEEIQFDIPEHWVWCRLREITLSIRDGSHNTPPDNGSGIPLLSGVNIDNNFINIHSATRWITQSEWEIENRRTNIECGDVLLTIVGTIGRSAVVETDEHFALQRSVAVLKPCQIFSAYLMNVLQAPTTQRWFSNNGKGTAQKGIYLNMLYKLMIPIPPLREQVKISEALNVLMDRMNDIENQIA